MRHGNEICPTGQAVPETVICVRIMKTLSAALSSLCILVALGLSQPVSAADTNATASTAALRLPAIFGDNMVLQHQQPIPVWGWSAPGATITVKFAKQSKSTRADANGRWLIKLGKLPASFTPQTLTVEAGQTAAFTNVLVGEVWLCSGQSNMEKPIGNQPGQKPCFNAESELATATFPNIRIFKVQKILSAVPLDDFKEVKAWRSCDSNALNTVSFSAVASLDEPELQQTILYDLESQEVIQSTK